MELTLALQESQRLVTTWQTPLLFVVVQVLIVLIFFKESTATSTSSCGEEEEGQGLADFWSSTVYMPSQLSRLPSFSAALSSSFAASASLPASVVVGLRRWAKRASCHVSSFASSQQSPSLSSHLGSHDSPSAY